MKSLAELSLPKTLDTSTADLIEDFFVPVLAHAARYDRGVGFFSSGWLRIAAKGMVPFATNGGRGRWVTSPILSEADWEALQMGDAARDDPILRAALARNIDDLAQMLEQETLSALAWMIADEILTFKLALPQHKLAGGEFHDKFGVFSDDADNQVSFNGSYNESIQGTRNYESIKIFCSWESAFTPLVQADIQRFEKLWHNQDPNVRVFDLPDAAKEQILQLRKDERPYPEPEWVKLNRLRENRVVYQPAILRIPETILLRDYQQTAIDAWFANECKGLFEMATGTGKTITALAASIKLLESQKRLLLVIVCPYKHLVSQWAANAQEFGYHPICVAESRSKWESEVARNLQNFQRKQTNLVTLITTNDALHSGILPEMLKPVWPEALLIIDEAHHAGAPKMLASLPKNAPHRLGLSATPIRHYDEDGSEAILDYFDKIVFSLPLEQVIGTFLTPYYYRAIPVEITDEEFIQFSDLTRKLQRYMHSDEGELSEAAQKIAIQRARVLNNSAAKLEWLHENIDEYARLKHTLFYVGEQVFGDVRTLLGYEKRIRIHEFTQRQNNKEREEILNRFEQGNLQALVAMKCLDEGVDVPPTRTAYFLASSGSPREFVQRRGRVLRRSPGKEYATVIDLIAIPPRNYIDQGETNPDFQAVKAAIRREYRRVKEFARLAQNHYQALDEMFEIADRLNLLDV